MARASIKVRSKSGLDIAPVTPDRWEDVAQLFGEKGACAGCWCMYWRLSASDWEQRKGAKNKRAFKRLITSGSVPGVMAYVDGEPVGWCAITPRVEYPRLARSRVLKPVDEKPVWSIVCLFVARPHRQSGISVALLRGACDYAMKQGAKIVEGYPTEPRTDRMPDAFAWTGLASAFRKAGFKEVARRSETRPIMRRLAVGC